MIEKVAKATIQTGDKIYRKFKDWPLVFRLPVAVGLIILGITGIILPVMPGWIFLIPGVMLLSRKDGNWLKEQAREWATKSKRW